MPSSTDVLRSRKVVIPMTLQVPEGVTQKYEKGVLTVKGPRGSLSRTFSHPDIRMSVAGNCITVDAPGGKGKRNRSLVGTWIAHAKNMVRGVTAGYTYQMKAVYSHFPMKLSVKGQHLVIENFLGEHHPRSADIAKDVKVTVAGEALTLEGNDLEAVGITAANIERASSVKDYDPRVFQDGIYITRKG